MRHALPFLAVVLAIAAVVQAQAIDRAKLVGTWENAGRGYNQTQIFRADGTFEVTIRSDVAMMNRQESGKWELEESVLTLTVGKSSTEGRAGRSARFKVYRLTDDELVIQRDPANPNEKVTFKRVR